MELPPGWFGSKKATKVPGSGHWNEFPLRCGSMLRKFVVPVKIWFNDKKKSIRGTDEHKIRAFKYYEGEGKIWRGTYVSIRAHAIK